jgi:ribosomal protein L40E
MTAGIPSPRDGPSSRTRFGVVVALLGALVVVGSLPPALSPLALGDASHLAPPPAPVPFFGSDPVRPASSPPVAGARPTAGFTLSWNGRSPSSISLAWSATSDLFFSSYTVESSLNGSIGPWETAGVVTSQSTTELGVGGLAPGGAYSWRVVETGTLGTETTNVITVAQPTLAYLNFTWLTGTSATFNWTNNATYGGLLTFVLYGLYESVDGSAATVVATFASEDRTSTTLTGLSSGSSYGFELNTTDCFGGCGGGTPELSVTESNGVTLGTPLPLVASLLALRPAVDVGEPDLFSCTPSGGVSPYNFSWAVGAGGYVAGNASESFEFLTVGSTKLSCLATDAAHDESTAATTVVVDPFPTLSLALNRSTADVGELTLFTCTPAFGDPPYDLSWTFGDGQSLSGGSVSYAYPSAGEYAPTCTLTDSTGTQLASSEPLEVDPGLTGNASADSPRAAPGSPIAFAAHPRGGTGSYSAFQWEFGDGGTATGENVTHAYPFTGPFTATVRFDDSNGVSAEASTSVVVSPIIVHLSATPLSIKVGGSVVLTAAALGGAGNYTFSWTFGDGSTGTGASVTHVYRSAGSYHPSVVATDALGGTNTTNAPTITVTAPTTPSSWLTGPVVLLLAAVVGVVGWYLGGVYGRRRDEEDHRTVAGYIPPVAPSKTVQRVKVCRACGTTNVPLRETCTHCGASLPRLLS